MWIHIRSWVLDDPIELRLHVAQYVWPRILASSLLGYIVGIRGVSQIEVTRICEDCDQRRTDSRSPVADSSYDLLKLYRNCYIKALKEGSPTLAESLDSEPGDFYENIDGLIQAGQEKSGGKQF